MPLDVNGREPLIGSSPEWPRPPSSEGRRTSERRRKRRRARKPNDIRAKIRLRMWLACTGALLVMAVGLYLALGRDRSGESGLHFGDPPGTVAAAVVNASPPG